MVIPEKKVWEDNLDQLENLKGKGWYLEADSGILILVLPLAE